MKPNTMVGAVIVFGLLVAIVTPHMTEIVFRNSNSYNLDSSELASNQMVNVESSTEDTTAEIQDIDLAIASSEVSEQKPVQEETQVVSNNNDEKNAKSTETEVVKEETVNAVYEGLTMDELTAKLDKHLHSNLSGTGVYFARYSVEYGVDPYLVTAIALHETGCKWKCSTNVTQCNNVGGMKSGGTHKCNGTSYTAFDSLESGIKGFVYNIKVNYWDKGLTTAQAMNSKYAASGNWSAKVNSYMNSIRNS